MTAIKYPREFASDANFASGTDSGTPTKVDPGAAAEAQGAIAGLPFAAAHHNFSLNAISLATRYQIEQALSNLCVPVVSDVSALPEQAFDGPGAAIVNHNGRTLLIKGGVVLEDSQGGVLPFSAAPASACQPTVAAGPRATSNTLAVSGSSGLPGTVGNIAYSTDGGATWLHFETANGDQTQPLIFTPTSAGLFFWSGGTVAEVYRHTTFSGAKTTIALSAAHICRGLAVRESSFAVLALRSNAGAPEFDISTNATSFSATGGQPASMADYGAIAANSSTFFWAGKNGSNQISVQASSNGAAWSEVATIASPSGTIGTAPSCRLVCDVSSGILWLAVNANSRWYLYASPDSGLTWIGPRDIGASFPALSAAGGFLYVGISGRPMLRTPFRLS